MTRSWREPILPITGHHPDNTPIPEPNRALRFAVHHSPASARVHAAETVVAKRGAHQRPDEVPARTFRRGGKSRRSRRRPEVIAEPRGIGHRSSADLRAGTSSDRCALPRRRHRRPRTNSTPSFTRSGEAPPATPAPEDYGQLTKPHTAAGSAVQIPLMQEASIGQTASAPQPWPISRRGSQVKSLPPSQ